MDIQNFFSAKNLPLIDVRSESEFKQGHIPGAINKPILNDEERKLVGTYYKEKGSEEAVILGYELVGSQFADKIREIKKTVSNKEVIVYCWRGGLRSKIFTQLLENSAYDVSRIEGGYKTYRNWTLQKLEQTYQLLVLGGPTGCGKTEILHLLREQGEQIIDLEGLANHKGSAYGGISMPAQSSNEQFENQLAFELQKLDASRPIWIENESRLLGNQKIHDGFFEQMRTAKLLEISLSTEIRAERILEEYAILPKEELIAATQRLEKRLGGARMKAAINHIQEEEFEKWIAIMMEYYDKAYAHGSSSRAEKDIHSIQLQDSDMATNANQILQYFKENIL